MGIALENVSFTYQEGTPLASTALSDVSLTIEDGSYTALIGHTGSGKSTILQLLNGLLVPSQGSVRVFDTLITSTSKNKEIRKDYDMTVISITHDLEEVAMSDRVLIMKKGEIESTSSPRELFSRNDLDQIGLDDPFANQLKHSLSQNGYDLPENYLTESELEDKLWELL